MSKLTKILGVVVVLAMLIGVMPMTSAAPVSAAAGTLKWDALTAPASVVSNNSDFFFHAVAPNGATTWATGQVGGVGTVRYAVTTGTGTWRNATAQVNAAGGVAPFGKIAIAPDDGNVIAIVASTGAGFRNSVFVSTDAGITFTNSNFAIPAGNLADTFISDIQWSPSYSVGGGQGRDLAVTTYNTLAGVALAATVAPAATGATLAVAATGATVAAVQAIGSTVLVLGGTLTTNLAVGQTITIPATSLAQVYTITAVTPGVDITVTPGLTVASAAADPIVSTGITAAATTLAVSASAWAAPGGTFTIGAEPITVATVVDATHITVTRTAPVVQAAAAPITSTGFNATATTFITTNNAADVAGGLLVVGRGLVIGTEAVVVAAIPTATSITVARGQYGTTAAAQAAAAPITESGKTSSISIYQMKTTGFATGWVDVSTSLGEGFLAVEFPAGYGGDLALLVLAQSGPNVVLHLGLRDINAAAAPYVNWDATKFAGYPMVVAAVGAVPAISGDIATPADFAGQVSRQQRAWVAFDNGVAGNVYRIDGSRPAVLLNAGVRPYMLAYSGSFTTGKLLVSFVEGASTSATVSVVRSLNAQSNSPTWDPPYKAPTGAFGAAQSRTWVGWAPDGKAAWALSASTLAINAPAAARAAGNWVGAANDESALSYSTDDGDSWNGRNWIDTTVTRYTAAVVSQDNTVMYNATVNVAAGMPDSIWKSTATAPTSLGSGERVAIITEATAGANSIIQVKIAKDKADGSAVFWGKLGSNVIQRSIDKGQTWNSTGSVSTGNIADFVATDANTLYTLGAVNGKVAKGTATGFSWTWGAEVATLMTTGYMIDGVGQNIIATSTYPSVSLDGGATWVRNLGTTPAGTAGNAIVAMDADFANNKYYYTAWTGTAAAPVAGGLGPQVARSKAPGMAYEALGDVATGFPQVADVVYAGIAASPVSGNFYALRTPSNVVGLAGVAANQQGARRTLDGTKLLPKPGITTDQLNVNLATTADFLWLATGAPVVAPNNLSVTGSGNTICLWAINTAAATNRPVGFVDTMVTAKAVTTPAGKATADVAFNGFNVAYPVKWGVVGASAGYDSQLALTSDFADVILNNVNLAPVNVSDPTIVIANGVMMAGSTYYFRVRVASVESTQVIHSPWSETLAITVKAGAPVQQTSTGVQPAAPTAGAQGVNITGVGFAWTAIQGATEYKFVLASDATMTKTLVSTTVKGTGYMYDGKLTNDTAYFWQVTPVGGDPSAVFAFTTKGVTAPASTATPAPIVIPAPVVNIPAASTATPVWVWAVIGVGAVLVIVTLVLIFRTRRV